MSDVNAKSTKAEILKAFEELQKELEQTKRELRSAKRQAGDGGSGSGNGGKAKASGADTPAPSTAAKLNGGEGAVDIAQVVDTMDRLDDMFNQALSRLSTELLVKSGKLKDISQDVENERTQLKELYHLETIGDDTLDQLIDQYRQRSEANQVALVDKRRQTEAHIEQGTRSWQTEREKATLEFKEYQAQTLLAQERADREYAYKLQLERQTTDEEAQRVREERERELQAYREKIHHQWTEEEEKLAAEEKAFQEAKEKAERFPAELEAAERRAREEGKGIGASQAKRQAALAKSAAEAELETLRLQVAAADEEAAKLSEQIDGLTLQLDSSITKVQELAVKAIEGASSHGSFEALREITLEQAKAQAKK
ncbi:MAG: hypothetical protein ACFCBW_22820 [Candidatus Competibacterales bacterium]